MTKLWTVGFAMGMLVALSAQAQVRPAYEYPDASLSSPHQLGNSPFFGRAYVGAGFGYDDNVLLTPDNKRSSNFWTLSPGATIDAHGPSTVFVAKYQAQIGRYSDSSQDDYEDQTLGAVLDWRLDRRNFLRLGLDAARAHEPRGSTDRPRSDEPDKYRLVVPGVTYSFGAPGAQGRIDLYASEAQRRYLNNEAFTKVSDRDTTEFGGAFYWRVAPKTYALFEARHTDISYKIKSPSDSTENRLYAGVTWNATAATTGTLKVGRLERKLDSGPSEADTSWEGLVTWLPRTYSRFDFYTSRQTNEPTGQGLYILSSVVGVLWTHNWNSVFTTGVNLRYQKDQYRGFDRHDENTLLGLKAGYKFRRWLTLGAEYTRSERDSTQPISNYDKNFYLLTATASM